MLKINFAVWNMQGTNKNDQRFTAHRKKINMLLEYKINGKEPLDLVFFQEISNPEIVFQENPPDRITRILSASVISLKKKKHPLLHWLLEYSSGIRQKIPAKYQEDRDRHQTDVLPIRSPDGVKRTAERAGTGRHYDQISGRHSGGTCRRIRNVEQRSSSAFFHSFRVGRQSRTIDV